MRNVHIQTDIPGDTIVKPGLTVAMVTERLNTLASALGFARLFQVVIDYEGFGSRFTNTLWYAADSLLESFWADAESIAFQVEQEVIPKLQAVVPHTYAIKNIAVRGFTTLFDGLYDEYNKGVSYSCWGGYSGRANTITARPAYLFRYHLQYPNGLVGTILDWLNVLPRRGRLYVPAGLEQVDAGETVRDGFLGQFYGHMVSLAEKLSAVLVNASPPVTYQPIRVRVHRIPILNRILYTGYLPVRHVTPSTEVSFLARRDV